MFQVPAISTAWGPFWPQKVWPSVAWQEFRFEGTRTTSWSTKGWCAWSKSPRASQPFLRAWERTSRCETTARQGDLSKVLGGLSLVEGYFECILWRATSTQARETLYKLGGIKLKHGKLQLPKAGTRRTFFRSAQQAGCDGLLEGGLKRMSGLRPWNCLAACTGRFSKGQTKLIQNLASKPDRANFSPGSLVLNLAKTLVHSFCCSWNSWRLLHRFMIYIDLWFRFIHLILTLDMPRCQATPKTKSGEKGGQPGNFEELFWMKTTIFIQAYRSPADQSF